jgi:tRNA(fMet)-specific endonuclease VapC
VTTYRTMLDTNIVSDLIRNPQGKVAGRLVDHGEKGVCVSIVTASELRFGAIKRGSARLSAQVDVVLGAMEVVPFDSPADLEYGVLRARLEIAGTPMGSMDLLIAAQALAMGVMLVTRNVSEFGRVTGLVIENWLE